MTNEETTVYPCQFNYLAIKLLEYLGNSIPNQEQIDILEDLLSMTAIKQDLVFKKVLNSKEIACLYWASRGKSSKETAKLLNATQGAIETMRKDIKRKLNCANITHAVFEGIRFGYIQNNL